jgi:hypothetical protein
MAALAGYYDFEHFAQSAANLTFLGGVAVVWFVAGVPGSPVVGDLAAYWARAHQGCVGIAIPAALIGEGVFFLLRLVRDRFEPIPTYGVADPLGVCGTELVVGIALAVVYFRYYLRGPSGRASSRPKFPYTNRADPPLQVTHQRSGPPQGLIGGPETP